MGSKLNYSRAGRCIIAGVVAFATTTVLAQAGAADDSLTTPEPNGQLTDAQVASVKARLDKTAWDIGPTRPLTTAEVEKTTAKYDAAKTSLAHHGVGSLATAMAASSYPASASVAANQVAQTTTYYCGPAAVKEALGQRGIGGTQAGLADTLNTTTDGTAWSGVNADVPNPTGRPVPDVLNYKVALGGQNFYYTPVSVSDPATADQKAGYQQFLTVDLSQGWPLEGNAYEVPGGPHLVGHPNITIHHWFDIRGYNSSGANTLYEDSVHGSSVSWAGGVPAYSTILSDTIARIVGGRGYVW